MNSGVFNDRKFKFCVIFAQRTLLSPSLLGEGVNFPPRIFQGQHIKYEIYKFQVFQWSQISIAQSTFLPPFPFGGGLNFAPQFFQGQHIKYDEIYIILYNESFFSLNENIVQHNFSSFKNCHYKYFSHNISVFFTCHYKYFSHAITVFFTYYLSIFLSFSINVIKMLVFFSD